MRLSNASSLLLAAATALLSSTQQSPALFASAQHSGSKPRSCPGGVTPDSDGSCPNPDMDEESSSSSDDDAAGIGDRNYSGNPNAHRMEEGEEKPPTTCDSYLKLAGFKDAVYETRSFYQVGSPCRKRIGPMTEGAWISWQVDSQLGPNGMKKVDDPAAN